jgi:hypothetical protein
MNSSGFGFLASCVSKTSSSRAFLHLLHVCSHTYFEAAVEGLAEEGRSVEQDEAMDVHRDAFTDYLGICEYLAFIVPGHCQLLSIPSNWRMRNIFTSENSRADLASPCLHRLIFSVVFCEELPMSMLRDW